jgi:hypothetical protein
MPRRSSEQARLCAVRNASVAERVTSDQSKPASAGIVAGCSLVFWAFEIEAGAGGAKLGTSPPDATPGEDLRKLGLAGCVLPLIGAAA